MSVGTDGAERVCPWSSANPARVQPMVPFLSADTRFGIPAFTSDCAPMMLLVRPAQFTTTSDEGDGAAAGARYTSSAPGTLSAVGMLIVRYSSNRRAVGTNHCPRAAG